VVEKKTEAMSKEKISEGLQKMAEEKQVQSYEIEENLKLSKIVPIVTSVQEQLSSGKEARFIKASIRSHYLPADIQVASEALSVVLTGEGLTEEHINASVEQGKISSILGDMLKKIGKKYPIRKSQFESQSSEKTVGVQAYLYPLDGRRPSDQYDTYRNASVEALRKGIDIGRVKAKLREKLTSEEAGRILSDAVNMLNATPAGAIANRAQKVKSSIEVPELPVPRTLPDESTIIPKTQEILSWFEGVSMDIDIDSPRSQGSLDVNLNGANAGMDGAI
jgi:hypothetical protein